MENAILWNSVCERRAAYLSNPTDVNAWLLELAMKAWENRK